MARRRRKKRITRSERRKAIYVLPNLCTTASLLAGFYSIISSMEGDFFNASLAILASLVLDGLDGKVARATNTVSRFGVEYDSLADVVAFGAAPAILAFHWALKPVGRLGWLAAFLFVACGALRLARFNVQVESVGTKYFVGLPIPAAAATIATSVLMMNALGYPGPVNFWPVVIMVFVLSFLMVSNIHYLAFKELGVARLKSFNYLVAVLLFFTLIAIQPQVMGFMLMAAYVVLGPLGAHLMARRRAAHEAEEAAKHQEVTSA
ncbi:MAG: CDP-diacylglycerol--serine O-phosphatidyltransferase [Desulfarculaceae bacterium]|jgi:CDP-diacylglycerol--serine O-phosphatidyltransferase